MKILYKKKNKKDYPQIFFSTSPTKCTHGHFYSNCHCC